MDDDAETVRLQGSIPKDEYEDLIEKLPVSASGGDANLLRALIDDWERMRRLEEMRATGKYPATDEQENSN